MDRILWLVVALLFIGCGAHLARKAFQIDQKNVLESVGFGMLAVAFGLFLLYVALLGPPDQ